MRRLEVRQITLRTFWVFTLSTTDPLPYCEESIRMRSLPSF